MLWKATVHCRPFDAEHQFAPPRRWRFDFAWPAQKVAVEMEGGIWTRGAHTRGKHFRSDAEKYNAATIAGWRVLRYTTNDLHERPFQVIEEVRNLLESIG